MTPSCNHLFRFAFVAFFSGAVLSAAPPPSPQETQRQKQEQNLQRNQTRDSLQPDQRQEDQKDVRNFVGKVTEKDFKFYLEDLNHKASYLLADSSEPRRFLGKKVRVSGTFDEEKNLLHVRSISPVPN